MNQNQLGFLAAFLSSVTWAIGVSSYSVLSRTNAASTINFSRALTALPIFIFAFFLTNSSHLSAAITAVQTHHVLWLATSILCSYAIADALLLYSVSIIGLPSALAIGSGYPIWTALYSVILKGEPLTSASWCGLLLAVSGTIVVILSGKNTDNEPKNKNKFSRFYLGVLMGFATSILWAFNSVAVANGGSGIDPFLATAIRMVSALLLCPIAGRLMTNTKVLLLKKDVFIRSIWVFALEGFGGSFFFMYGLTHAPMAVAAGLSSLAPVISVPIAWIGRFEKPSFLRAAGVIMVVVGVWFLVGFASF